MGVYAEPRTKFKVGDRVKVVPIEGKIVQVFDNAYDVNRYSIDAGRADGQTPLVEEMYLERVLPPEPTEPGKAVRVGDRVYIRVGGGYGPTPWKLLNGGRAGTQFTWTGNNVSWASINEGTARVEVLN